MNKKRHVREVLTTAGIAMLIGSSSIAATKAQTPAPGVTEILQSAQRNKMSTQERNMVNRAEIDILNYMSSAQRSTRGINKRIELYEIAKEDMAKLRNNVNGIGYMEEKFKFISLSRDTLDPQQLEKKTGLMQETGNIFGIENAMGPVLDPKTISIISGIDQNALDYVYNGGQSEMPQESRRKINKIVSLRIMERVSKEGILSNALSGIIKRNAQGDDASALVSKEESDIKAKMDSISTLFSEWIGKTAAGSGATQGAIDNKYIMQLSGMFPKQQETTMAYAGSRSNPYAAEKGWNGPGWYSFGAGNSLEMEVDYKEAYVRMEKDSVKNPIQPKAYAGTQSTPNASTQITPHLINLTGAPPAIGSVEKINNMEFIVRNVKNGSSNSGTKDQPYYAADGWRGKGYYLFPSFFFWPSVNFESKEELITKKSMDTYNSAIMDISNALMATAK